MENHEPFELHSTDLYIVRLHYIYSTFQYVKKFVVEIKF